jgi:hypothetical protein
VTRLYVARDDKVTAVSRGRLRMSGAHPVRRDWRALVEVTASTPSPRRSPADAALVVLPPVLAGSLTAAFAPVEAGFAVGGVVFFAMSYLGPLIRGRAALSSGPLLLSSRAGRAALRPHRADTLLLSSPAERAALDHAIATADGIVETWPALGSLIDVPAAEGMLAEALWEIAGVLSRRQELSRVLADLSRPEFAAVATTGQTARELHAHLKATRAALSRIEMDLSRREASLRRAREAGRDFIRDQDLRRAIRAADESLRAGPEDFPGGPADPGADLAEHTQSVLAAYRELTAALRSNLPEH